MGTFKTLAAAGILTTMGAMGAHAATMTLTGGNALAFGSGNYDATCEGGVTTCYDPSGAALALAEDLTTFDSATPGPGLTLTKAARLTVTFLGKEAGAQNYAFSIAGGEISNNGTLGDFYTTLVGSGALDFSFRSDLGTEISNQGSVTGDAALGFSALFNGGRSVYAFFDDSGASNDRDYDDMVVRIDIAPVPVPAGLLLLVSGVAGLGIVRRRKAA